MKPADIPWAAVLALLCGLAWGHNRSWVSSASDALPLLLAWPVAGWLGSPWPLVVAPGRWHPPAVLLAGAALVAGALLDLCCLLALSVVAWIWAWLQPRLGVEARDRYRRLLALPFMSFPWVLVDAQPLGWWFRLSGAWTAEQVFGLMGFPVDREGTSVLVAGLPMSVEAACSGLNTLQSLLVAGTAVAFARLGSLPVFWPNLLLLLPLAWAANTLRILALTAAALTWGTEVASGSLHSTSGLVLLVAMFLGSAALFRREAEWWNRRMSCA